MTSVKVFAWLTLLLPLAGMLATALGWRWWPGRTAGWVATGALFGSFAAAIAMLVALQGLGHDERHVVAVAWDYASTAGVDAELALLVDPLSVFMALVVSGVSALIHLYSISYMGGDRGYRRFFAYLNYFVFSMLLLVLAANFLVLIIGWAFVGAASYLLISFWYRRTTATNAGIKAFVINVVGDVGLVLGTYFLFRSTGTLDFLETFGRVEEAFPASNDADLVAGLVLLLVGAFAKSAQVPLHTWLADAMEGPTPVSALIHAATMVTAGVYLIARMHPLFEQAPAAQWVGASIGAITLVLAATMALVVTDLKRVIAYSTMSQIGYMVMGVSAGAYAAGLFHLMTHAFFKALLFMAAGSVIGAMAGLQDLDRMGGFRRAMPFTFVTFAVGAAALAGLPPFSGWVSKDEILGLVADRGGVWWVLYGAGFVTAILTGVYAFRLVFRVFWGEPVHEARELEHGHLAHADVPRNPLTGEEEDTDVGFPGPEHHIAERAWSMKVPMALLAGAATVAGALQIPGVTHVIHDFLEPTFAGSPLYEELKVGESLAWLGLAVGAVSHTVGIAIAWLLWGRDRDTVARLRERLSGLHRLPANRWYFDEALDVLFVRPAAWFGRFAQQTFERAVVEGLLVGGTTVVVRAGSAAVRAAQTGFLRLYAGLLLAGLAAVALYFLVVA